MHDQPETELLRLLAERAGIVAEYYDIAGLSDKAVELSKSHEQEKEKSEAKRQEKFKQEQKSLEEELGI